jgi:hypothetical protein
MTGFSVMNIRPVIKGLLLVGGVLALSACGGNYRYLPGPSWPALVETPQVDPAAVAAELVTMSGPRESRALIDRATSDGRAAADVLLFEMGLILLSGNEADDVLAKALLARLVVDYPHSVRHQAAADVLGLLERTDELELGNAALRENLNQILKIDLESERQRQATTP